MKLALDQTCLVCEQCGKRGPEAESFNEMMKRACLDADFGYSWEHAGGLHTCHFYCPTCKGEFDCETRP